MTSLHYILQPLSDAERIAFRDNLSFAFGAPHRWFAFDEEGVLVECESRVARLTWQEVSPVITMGTLQEMSLSIPAEYSAFREFLFGTK